MTILLAFIDYYAGDALNFDILYLGTFLIDITIAENFGYRGKK